MKHLTINCEIEVYKYDELSDIEKELIDRAKKATERSYTPYSKFNVGAAALLEDGTIFEGNNQENAAYPSGICAERTTLFYANASKPDKAVKTLAVAAFTNGEFIDNPIPPCGACRQVMLETEQRFNTKMRILLYGRNNIYAMNGVENLLPLSFGIENLNK